MPGIVSQRPSREGRRMLLVLSMARRLLQLGRKRLEQFQRDEGLRILRRLLTLPNVPPAVLAKANFLIAQVQYDHEEFQAAHERLAQVVTQAPNNANYHFWLAASTENLPANNAKMSLAHYALAARLAPHDGRKTSVYACKLVATKARAKGLRLLEKVYVRHQNNAAVLENVVEGLLEADRVDDAELVVRRACYQHQDNPAFQSLKCRFRIRMVQRKIEQGATRKVHGNPARNELVIEEGEDEPAIIPFQVFGDRMRERARRRLNANQAKQNSRPEPVVGPVPLTASMTLVETLKAVGANTTGLIYQALGLVGKNRVATQRRELEQVFGSRTFLTNVIKRLPDDSRKLLRTLVRAGGYVPASTLFQNTGPEAPPPDYVQPLLQRGLLFLGEGTRTSTVAETPLVAMIPADLLRNIAVVLRVPLDEQTL